MKKRLDIVLSAVQSSIIRLAKSIGARTESFVLCFSIFCLILVHRKVLFSPKAHYLLMAMSESHPSLSSKAKIICIICVCLVCTFAYLSLILTPNRNANGSGTQASGDDTSDFVMHPPPTKYGNYTRAGGPLGDWPGFGRP
jgi:hypothetical protein